MVKICDTSTVKGPKHEDRQPRVAVCVRRAERTPEAKLERLDLDGHDANAYVFKNGLFRRSNWAAGQRTWREQGATAQRRATAARKRWEKYVGGRMFLRDGETQWGARRRRRVSRREVVWGQRHFDQDMRVCGMNRMALRLARRNGVRSTRPAGTYLVGVGGGCWCWYW